MIKIKSINKFFIAFSCLIVLISTRGFFLINTSHKIEQARIAYPLKRLNSIPLDPASIELIDEGLIISNIYGRLVELDENGKLQAGISKTFYWQDDVTLVFEFDKKAKSNDGHYIDAEDAAYSIRRLLYLGYGTHSDLNFFLREKNKLKSPSENSTAIYTKDNKLFLKLSDKEHRSYLLSSLASGDFSIIPKKSIDPITFKITNYKITSGPYFIESKVDNQWILSTNDGHYCLQENTPQKIILVSTDNSTATELLVENKVDIVSSLHNIGAKRLSEIQKKIKELTIEKTLKIKIQFLQFSPRAQEKFSKEYRSIVAKKFRSLIKEKYPLSVDAEETNTFFQNHSIGHLTSEQSKNLNSFLNSNKEAPNFPKITFQMYKSNLKNFNIFHEINEIEPIIGEDSPYDKPIDQRLDLFLAMTDTAFESNLTLLAYNFTMGTFGLNREEGNIWIEKYLKLKDKKDQAAMTQELQYKALMDGVIFPLFSAPYTTLGRNGFSMPLSPIFATSYFWKIRKQ